MHIYICIYIYIYGKYNSRLHLLPRKAVVVQPSVCMYVRICICICTCICIYLRKTQFSTKSAAWKNQCHPAICMCVCMYTYTYIYIYIYIYMYVCMYVYICHDLVPLSLKIKKIYKKFAYVRTRYICTYLLTLSTCLYHKKSINESIRNFVNSLVTCTIS